MTVGMERYEELLHMVGDVSTQYIDPEILEALKDEYKDKISSKRTLESIKDLKSLLKVLEKRGILQFDKVSVLKYIAQQFMKDKSIEDLISEYEQWLEENSSKINYLYCHAIVPRTEPAIVTKIPTQQIESKMPVYLPNVNIAISSETRFTNHTQFYGIPSTSTARPAIDREKELQELIINEVSRKIGRFWEDASRKLNLEESVIEEIENRYFNELQSHEKMFKEALKLYFAEHHPRWKIELKEALESCRRNDLKKMVEDIIHAHNS